MLLTGHSQESNLQRAVPFIQALKPKYWVALDPPPDAAAAVAAVDTKLIVRRFWPYDFNQDRVRGDMGKAPADAAAEFVGSARSQGWYQHAWAVMTPPAMASGNSPADLLEWSIQFMSACVSQLKADGKECFVANVPTGNDGFLVPGASFYACQEYGWPCVDSQASASGGPFHAYRYRDWFEPIRRQQPHARLGVLECGSTALLPNPHPHSTDAPHGADVGWQGGFGIPQVAAEEYWQGLARYDAEAQADGYVLLLAIYQIGANDDWRSFEHLGTEMERRLLTLAQQSPPIAPRRTQEDVTGPVPEPAVSVTEPVATTVSAPSTRTPDQQNLIDVANGWSRAFADDAARLAVMGAVANEGQRAELAAMAARQLEGARQLGDVARGLESEFPVS